MLVYRKSRLARFSGAKRGKISFLLIITLHENIEMALSNEKLSVRRYNVIRNKVAINFSSDVLLIRVNDNIQFMLCISLDILEC